MWSKDDKGTFVKRTNTKKCISLEIKIAWNVTLDLGYDVELNFNELHKTTLVGSINVYLAVEYARVLVEHICFRNNTDDLAFFKQCYLVSHKELFLLYKTEFVTSSLSNLFSFDLARFQFIDNHQKVFRGLKSYKQNLLL